MSKLTEPSQPNFSPMQPSRVIRFVGYSSLILSGIGSIMWVISEWVAHWLWERHVMVPLTEGISFALCSWLLLRKLSTQRSGRFDTKNSLICILILIIAGVSMAELAWLRSLWQDSTWQFTETFYKSGVMTYSGAFTFAAFVAALCLGGHPKPRLRWISQLVLHLITILASLALFSYLFDIKSFEKLANQYALSIPSAFMAFMLSIGGSLLNPDAGLSPLLSGNQPGSRMARLMLPATLLAIVIMGSFRVWLVRHEYVSSDFGFASFAVLFMALISIIVLQTAKSLNQADLMRSQAEEALREAHTRQAHSLKLKTSALERSLEDRVVMENRFRMVFEHAILGMAIVNLNGEIASANQSLARLTGTPKEDLVGRKLYSWFQIEDLLPHPVLSPSLNWPNDCLKGELLMQPDQGSPLWTLVDAVLHRDNHGQPIYFIYHIQDIDAVKVHQELLTKQNSELRALLETDNHVAIIGTNKHGQVTHFSKGAETLLGYSAETMVKKMQFGELLNPQQLQAHQTGLDFEGYANPTPFQILTYNPLRSGWESKEWSLKRQDGRWVTVQLVVTALKNIHGSVMGFISIATDVGARKEADSKFKNLLESAPDAMIIANDKGIIELANDQAVIMFGYSKEELIGREVETLIPKRFGEKHHHYRTEYQKAPHPRGMGEGRELYGLRKNGEEFPVEISLSPLITGESRLVSAAIRDVTDRKQVEKELIQAKEIAEKSVIAKEHFLANMSHEIRTPLNALIGFSQLLEQTPLNDEQREYVESVSISGKNLLTLINDILDYSKIEAGMMTLEQLPVNINKLLQSIEVIFRQPCTHKNIALCLEMDPRLDTHVVADPLHINQILINLVGNAIKFTEKGQITLKSEVMECEAGSTRLRISISDTGIVIKPEQMNKIFERFGQADSDTSRKYGGTGLGINIVQGLLALYHTKLRVESHEGVGSTFSFELNLPMADEIHQKTMPTHALTLQPLKNGKAVKILLVEDNLLNQRLALAVLNKMGCETQVAENGKVALELMKEYSFDIILMDMQMPEMDGYEATKVIRNQLQNPIPIVAMTAHAMAGEREKCFRLGMNGYIAKPFNLKDLQEAIEKFSPSFRS
ncbi:MAG TPA: PAS domain S-box protein [Luteibaculaceae bacterium]|nr:PAS domain S-box protein [Luteibaculaceae bacterium]